MKFTYPPESTPLPGVTIKRAIHRGGFGEVYYGLTDAGKEVALKLLNQHTDIELRGATACLNLNHPNLVTIFDIRTDADGDHWVVMEYVGGKRLADVLDERRTLPVEEIERWLEGMTAGLTFLHDRGIVHRDLKPSNVFRENGVVKVGDVGLSKFISESRRSAHTQSVGTVYYMAPEVARGRYGREVDVYALAIMIYEMFTGDVPFDGESSGEILMKHLSERPNLEKLPAHIQPVISRALEKDPEQRTATAARLRDEFKAAVRGRFQEGRPDEHYEEAEELTEDSFIDHPGASYAAAAQADARDYSERARRRADAYRREAHDWNQRKRCYTKQQRAAVASAFGPGPRGCGPRRHHGPPGHHHHAHHKHCGGGPIELVKKKPWLILVAVAVFLLFTETGHAMLPGIFRIIIPTAIVGAYIFLIVLLVRYLTRTDDSKSPPRHVPHNVGRPPRQAPPRQTAARRYVTPPPAPAMFENGRYVLTPEARRNISLRSRASQLSGALVIAPLVTAALTACLAFMEFLAGATEIAFFGASTFLASWLILGVNKFVEGRGLTNGARRMLQAGVGAGIGGYVWMLQHFLMHRFDNGVDIGGMFQHMGDFYFIFDNQPSVAGYVVFFALLMLSSQWWYAADSYRKKQFSVWRTGLVGLIGFAATVLLPMPVMWGLLWAVAIFCVVQLSAPWTPPEQRVVVRS